MRGKPRNHQNRFPFQKSANGNGCITVCRYQCFQRHIPIPSNCRIHSKGKQVYLLSANNLKSHYKWRLQIVNQIKDNTIINVCAVRHLTGMPLTHVISLQLPPLSLCSPSPEPLSCVPFRVSKTRKTNDKVLIKHFWIPVFTGITAWLKKN